MSLYQIPYEQSAWAPPIALLRVAARTHLVADAVLTFALIILPMVAMVALLFWLGSAEPSAALPDAMDGTGMLILPP